MAKPTKPRHQRAKVRYGFEDGDSISMSLVEVTAELILQAAAATTSGSPRLREKGRAEIMKFAQFCVAGQLFLEDQKPKSKKQRCTIVVDDAKTSVAAICRKLAPMRDEMGDLLPPAELWPRFVGELDRLGLEPTEDKLGVSFDGGRTEKNTFRTTLRRERRKKI